MSDEDNIKRRALLKKSAAASASITGLSTATLARGSKPKEVSSEDIQAEFEWFRNNYRTADVKKAIEEHAKGLLKILFQEGVLKEPSAEAFPTDQVMSLREYLSSDEGTMITTQDYNGENSIAIKTIKLVGSDRLLLTVFPRISKAYAIEYPQSDYVSLVSKVEHEKNTNGEVKNLQFEDSHDHTIYDLNLLERSAYNDHVSIENVSISDVSTSACKRGVGCKVTPANDGTLGGLIATEVNCCGETCYWGSEISPGCNGADPVCCLPCGNCDYWPTGQ